MRKFNVVIIFLAAIVISFSLVGCGKNGNDGDDYATNATADDFVGNWEGELSYEPEDEEDDGKESLIIVLTKSDDGTLSGTYQGEYMDAVDISGSVLNGKFTFVLPNSTPNDPDCDTWNVTIMATLDTEMTTMTLNYSGTGCNSKPVSDYNPKATLTKVASP